MKSLQYAGEWRPTAAAGLSYSRLKSLQFCRPKLRPVTKLEICLRPTAGEAWWNWTKLANTAVFWVDSPAEEEEEEEEEEANGT
jgi:hypothetical protein